MIAQPPDSEAIFVFTVYSVLLLLEAAIAWTLFLLFGGRTSIRQLLGLTSLWATVLGFWHWRDTIVRLVSYFPD